MVVILVEHINISIRQVWQTVIRPVTLVDSSGSADQSWLGVSRPRLCKTQTDVLAETERNTRRGSSAILSSLLANINLRKPLARS